MAVSKGRGAKRGGVVATGVPDVEGAASAASATDGAGATEGAKRGRGRKAAAAPEPLAPKTYDDFRDRTLDLLRGYATSWGDYAAPLVAEWAQDADDAQVRAWLAKLDAASGCRSAAAGLIALDRARAGRQDVAEELVALGTRDLPDDEWGRFKGYQGMIPAWWRLGDPERAAREFAALRTSRERFGTMHNQLFHELFSLAAMGGRGDLVEELMPEVLKEGEYRDDLLRPGALALLNDGHDGLLKALMERWAAQRSWGDTDFTREFYRACLRSGALGRFVEHVLRWPKMFNAYNAAPVALRALARRDPARAVAHALGMLNAGDLLAGTRPVALSVLATHAPEEAMVWSAAHLEEAPELTRFALYAALGRDDEARALLPRAATLGRYGNSALFDVGLVTRERALACEAMAAYVRACGDDFGYLTRPFVCLVQLGERALVDATLEKRLADIAARPSAKDRDIPSRDLARAAGMVGRVDIGLAAWKLPSNLVRYCTASDLVQGCASVGDWTGAYAALEKVPDTSANGRVSTALQSGCIAYLRAQLDGPQALPPRCVDEARGE